jgi:hypothetical protein
LGHIESVLIKEVPISFMTRVFTLEDMPGYERQRHMAGYLSIAHYFIQLLEAKMISPQSCLLLPSLHSLTRFFTAPTLDVQKAFQHLRNLGLDYMMPGYYGHISLWVKSWPLTS